MNLINLINLINFIDIMMPNMDGYQLLEVLRSNEKTQTIPIILVSARACEDSRVLGIELLIY